MTDNMRQSNYSPRIFSRNSIAEVGATTSIYQMSKNTVSWPYVETAHRSSVAIGALRDKRLAPACGYQTNIESTAFADSPEK
jgi:hypothetical protein